MARKTKRQKLLSAQRRSSLLQKTDPLIMTSQSEVSFADHTSANRAASSKERQETEYFKQDFRKSFLYITAILALEVLLYFGITQYHFMK